MEVSTSPQTLILLLLTLVLSLHVAISMDPQNNHHESDTPDPTHKKQEQNPQIDGSTSKKQPGSTQKKHRTGQMDGSTYFRLLLNEEKRNLLVADPNDPRLTEENPETGDPYVTPLCLGHLKAFNGGLQAKVRWAKQVFSYQGVPGTSYVNSVGYKEGCNRHKAQLDSTTQMAFKFCNLHWSGPHLPRLGVCVPETCGDPDQVMRIVTTGYPKIVIHAVTCGDQNEENTSKPLLLRDYIGLCLAFTWLSIVFLASVPPGVRELLIGYLSTPCPGYLRRRLSRMTSHCTGAENGNGKSLDDNQNENKAKDSALQCFCLRENIEYLVNAPKHPAAYPFLHAFRIGAMIAITYLHTFLKEQMNIGNIADFYDFQHTSMGHFTTEVGVAVDIFFVIGGFLSMPSLIRTCSEDKSVGFFRLLARVMKKRYFRLAPVYFAVILLNVFLVPHMTSLPESPCLEKTWPHLTMTYNLMLALYGWEEGKCMPNTWYISADFQFHLMTFILVYISMRGSGKIRTWLVTVILASLAGLGIHRYTHPIRQPWTTYAFADHVPVYMIGAYLGQMYIDPEPLTNQKSRLKHLFNSTGMQSLCAVTCFYLTFLDVFVSLQEWPLLGNIYYVVMRVVFASGVCCLINICNRSKDSAVWCHPGWIPFSTLTYSMYVLSYTVQHIYTETDPFRVLWRPADLVLHSAGYLLITLPFAVLLFLLVERPAQRLLQ